MTRRIFLCCICSFLIQLTLLLPKGRGIKSLRSCSLSALQIHSILTFGQRRVPYREQLQLSGNVVGVRFINGTIQLGQECLLSVEEISDPGYFGRTVSTYLTSHPVAQHLVFLQLVETHCKKSDQVLRKVCKCLYKHLLEELLCCNRQL